jgi:hypothetical protein
MMKKIGAGVQAKRLDMRYKKWLSLDTFCLPGRKFVFCLRKKLPLWIETDLNLEDFRGLKIGENGERHQIIF